MNYLLLALLATMLVTVSAIHYAGFLAAEWLHLVVFEPLEIWLAAAIGRAWMGATNG